METPRMPDPTPDADDDSSTSDILDMRNEEGWEDVEGDEIDETYVSLFDEKSFSDITEMLTYCKTKHSFDIWQLQQQHNLDYLGLVRLVNYVRQQVKQGNLEPHVGPKSNFDDDIFLLPVMEDDAVLYSLEDIIQVSSDPVVNEADELREQLASLQTQFAAYREDVQKYLNTDLKDVKNEGSALPVIKEFPSQTQRDDDYFKSYSYNSIHESMLKDTIRTDAYRDFIYDNKDVFKDKVVLDVGCGTGILSMFCAKAGAKLVIAVDNSDILEKAKQNIANNHLEDKIKCFRGKIEEVQLPVAKVDIIVSEWMGYCLLYESMLDSVINARDKYLAADGLMVPSHVTIELAPLSDSELRISYIDFWKDVYGFNMTPMLEKAEEEVLTRTVESKELASASATILHLDLHNATVKDLDFTSDFKLHIKDGYDILEGFIIWFDAYFMTSRTKASPSPLAVDAAKAKGIVAFSTGPASKATHWQQGVCLIQDPLGKLNAGIDVSGTISFKKQNRAHRSLDVDISWEASGNGGRQAQKWFLE